MDAYISSVKEPVSLKSDPKPAPKEIKVDRPRLSENIRRFDRKPRVYTENPYSYNAVALKKNEPMDIRAEDAVADPLYNTAGKILGVDTVHDWNRYYNKVQAIVDWAKNESKQTEPTKIIEWLYGQMPKVNHLGNSRLDDVYIYAKFYKPTKPKVIVKKVIVKEKLTTEEMVKRIIQG